MAELPHMSLSTDAYLADTTHLDAQQHGAYLLLLITAWRCSGRPQLPDDDKLLARYAKVDPRTWRRIKPVIMAFWTMGADGFWTQKKQLKVRELTNKNVEKMRNISLRRWRPKSLEINEQSDAIALLQPSNHNHNHLNTPKSPSGTRLTKGKIPPGYRDSADPVYADFLANIWEKRWQRPGNNPALAFASFVKMTDADRTAAKAAIERCCKSIVANSSAPNYRPMMVTWLNTRGWEVDAGAPAEGTGPDWAKWVEAFRANGHWNPLALGPEPGKPNCRVPREFLVGLAGHAA